MKTGKATTDESNQLDDSLEPPRQPMRYPSKAATATRVLSATDVNCDSSVPRTIPLYARRLGAAASGSGAPPQGATALVDQPPSGHQVADSNATSKSIHASLHAHATTGSSMQGTATCAPTRGRLPGLRTLNGSSRSSGLAPVPLLLTSTRVAVETCGDSAAPGLRAAALTSALASARPWPEATTRRGSPPATTGPAAFLPPVPRHAAFLLSSEEAKRQQPSADAVRGAGAAADGVRAIGCAGTDSGGGAAGEVPPCSETTATAVRQGTHHRHTQAAHGSLREADETGAPRTDCMGGAGDDAVVGTSSYSSCHSCGDVSSDCGYGSAMEEEEEEGGHDAMEVTSGGHDVCGRASVEKPTGPNGGATAIEPNGGATTVGALAAAAPACTALLASHSNADATATAAAAAAADGGLCRGGGAPGGRADAHSRAALPTNKTKRRHSRNIPPWPLVPRAGRASTMRFSVRAARIIWPHLADTVQTEGQPVTLFLETPGDAGTQIIPVRALLKRYEEMGMVLRVLGGWPEMPGVPPGSLLQISPLPDGGDGALVQPACRQVWTRYYIRGGKLCCPVSAAAEGAAAEAAAAEEGEKCGSGSGNEVDTAGVLQLRLGSNLFDNRSFDVGIRASERLFGHLLGQQPEEEEEKEEGVGPAEAEGARTDTSAGEGDAAAERPGGNACSSGAGAVPSKPATRAKPTGRMKIRSLFVTVIPESWPEIRFQIEFRYRFPRMLGMPSNARHAYATLSADLVTPMCLYGAQPGDVFEMWHNPAAPPDEFMCRVVRVDREGVARKREPGVLGAAGILLDRPLKRRAASIAVAKAAVAAVAQAAEAAVGRTGAAAAAAGGGRAAVAVR